MGIPGRFGALVTAMATPFDAEGGVDLDAAATLARWLVANGSDGLLVAGTTGESPTLDDAEKLDLWRAVSEAVTVPVVAGSGSNDTDHSVRLTAAAAGTGVAGVLVVTPYYSRPSQAGIEAHVTAVAGATRLPVLVYDIPVRTGRKVAHDTLVRLARDVPNVVGVKDAAGNPAGSARLVADAPAGFDLYSGDDALTLPLLAVGACGAIGVASHWAGRLFAEMMACFARGEVVEARALNARLLDSFDFETGDEAPNPVPTKAMLDVLGLAVGACRLPMGPAPAGLAERARRVLADLGEWGATARG